MYDHQKACDEALRRLERQITGIAMHHLHEIHTAFLESRLKLGLPTSEPQHFIGAGGVGGILVTPITDYKIVCVGAGGGGFGVGGETPSLQLVRRRPPMPAAPPRPVVRNYTQQSKAVDDNFVSGMFVGHMMTGAADFSGGSDSSSSGD